MVSQFKSSHDVVLLGDINFEFPEGIHAIGRLDNHSEGLLLLTTDKTITKKLFQSDVSHERKYLVMVKNTVTPDTLKKLRSGVSIRIKGGSYYTARPEKVEIVSNPGDYITLSKDKVEYTPSDWLMMTLTEGKYHQGRKMVAAVGHRCKRLIRVAIEDITLGDLQPGEVREIAEVEFFRLLKIKK